MSIKEYMASINKEFVDLNGRIRNLVNHWGEDGKYKEEILKSVLKRFVPKSHSVYTGFVIKSGKARNNHTQSKQIDVIIYDNRFPILLKEGDFVIVPPDGVAGIIEVKTDISNINGLDFSAAICACNKNAEFICSGRNGKRKFFNGLFSYKGKINGPKREEIRRSANELKSSDSQSWILNHLASGSSTFIKYWGSRGDRYFEYEIPDMSFAFFVTNLVECVSETGFGDQGDLWFPLDKEDHKIDEF